MSNKPQSEYRLEGVDSLNKPVRGVIQAASMAEARKKARTLATTRGIKLVSVSGKKTFIYRARKGDKVIDGEQVAFQKEDVNAALQKIGYRVIYVRRKLFDVQFKRRIPAMEIVSFLGSCAKLLEEKLPFSDVLQVLTSNVRHDGLKNSLREIVKDLKDGVDPKNAFLRQEKAFGKNVALMLSIASKSDNVTEILQSVSKFVERESEFNKGLRSSLLVPGVTMVALVGALAFYVYYVMPQMAKVFTMAKAQLPYLTRATLDVSAFLESNFLVIAIVLVIAVVAFYNFIRSPQGREIFDRWIIRVPYVGRILHNTGIELFCRVLGIIYSPSGENIDSISIAAEASRNKHIEKRIKTIAIPQMVQFGVELPLALDATKVFPEIAISRFRSAAETGGVKTSAVQLADFYELENKYALKNLIDVIQLAVSFIIMVVMIFLTLVSSETANVPIRAR
jgi:type IV pilus assembly protein PilC